MISSLKLLRCDRAPVSKTLFDRYPELSTIWRTELSEYAKEATTEWENNSNETGEICCYIYDGKAIGVTGWYAMDDNSAGIRWHGVLPDQRGNGYGRLMLEAQISRIPSDYQYIYEVTSNSQSKLFFEKCGFEVVTDRYFIESATYHAGYDITEAGWALVLTR